MHFGSLPSICCQYWIPSEILHLSLIYSLSWIPLLQLASSTNNIAENGGDARNSRGVSWRHEETLDLLAIWGEQEVQEQLHSSHCNIESFVLIAQAMAEKGHNRTAKECRTKTKGWSTKQSWCRTTDLGATL